MATLAGKWEGEGEEEEERVSKVSVKERGYEVQTLPRVFRVLKGRPGIPRPAKT